MGNTSHSLSASSYVPGAVMCMCCVMHVNNTCEQVPASLIVQKYLRLKEFKVILSCLYQYKRKRWLNVMGQLLAYIPTSHPSGFVPLTIP